MSKKGPDTTDRCAACWTAAVPIRIISGVLLFLISMLIAVSVALSSIDKLMHSECKNSCGWTIPKPTLLNPIDFLLSQLSKVFPLDYLIFGALCIYIFICTVSGLVSLGIRLLIFKLYDIRKNHTMPTALLMGSWMLMFVVLALNMEILTLSPQYATFGNQFYYAINNSTNTTGNIEPTKVKEWCIMDASNTDGQCVMTQVGHIINLINIQLPFFGVIFFFANLLFVLSFFIFVIRGVVNFHNQRESYQTLKDREETDIFYSED